jgi:hypothetical protein
MPRQAGSARQEGHEYTQSLLRERHRELQNLEIKHRLQQIPTSQYLSCRRSLLQAISELTCIERDELDSVPSLRTETEDALK